MFNNTTLKGGLPLSVTPEAVFKVTALNYLKETLVNQNYEACPELIGLAKAFGAHQEEIDIVIADYLRTYTKDGAGGQSRLWQRPYRANLGKNRLLE